MTLAIRHEPEARRFVADVGGKNAYLTYRDLDGRVLELDHTYVPREFRGGGIASQLTVHALEYARERGYRIVPSCPFVAAYLERHPEYRELNVGV
jgi:predicted GNAT family acetyltransferase